MAARVQAHPRGGSAVGRRKKNRSRISLNFYMKDNLVGVSCNICLVFFFVIVFKSVVDWPAISISMEERRSGNETKS